MIDLACSLALLAAPLLVGGAYGARVLLRGRLRNERVERDGGSALLGTGPMLAAYWVLEPAGAFLARRGVTPDAITLGSLAVALAAAALVVAGHLGAGALAMALASFGDALDGIVARRTGTSSPAGEVLDAAVDRYEEFAFLAAVAVHYRAHVAWMGLALAALLGSMMTSYASAKGEALRVETPRGAMRRPERAVYLTLGAGLGPIASALFGRVTPWAGDAPLLLALGAVALVANVSAISRFAAIMRSFRRPPGPGSPPDDALPRRLARHQLGGLAAAVVDVGALVAVVEWRHGGPVLGTVVGASLGAATNFALSRRWVFPDHGGTAPGQAARYALVSGASLGLNALGEYALAVLAGLPYLPARLAVAAAVSLLWNFPMHRWFVFPRRAEAS